jgi:phage shock protein A
MDLPEVVAYVGIVIALLWAGYERLRAGRVNNSQYVENLASAAHDLVSTYRTQVIDLQLRMKDLNTRLARLEHQLETHGCQKAPTCPLREWVKNSESS